MDGQRLAGQPGRVGARIDAQRRQGQVLPGRQVFRHRRRLVRQQPDRPEVGRRLAQRRLEAGHQGPGLGRVALGEPVDQLLDQRRDQKLQDPARRGQAVLEDQVGPRGVERDLILVAVLAHDAKRPGIELGDREQGAEVVAVAVRRGDDPGGVLDRRARQGRMVGVGPDDDRALVDLVGLDLRVDDAHLEAVGPEVAVDPGAHPPVSAQDPVAPGRLHRHAEPDPARAHEPGIEVVQLRAGDRPGDELGEDLERIDHGDVVQRAQVGLVAGRGRATDDPEPRIEVAGHHRDLEVDVVVVGQRDQGPAGRVLHPRGQQVLGHAGVRVEPRHRHRVVAHAQGLDALRVGIEDHRAHAVVAQAPGQQAAGIAEPAEDDEGLRVALDLAGEAEAVHGLDEVGVLHQVDQRADRIEPGDDAGIEAEDRPQPLLLAEAVGQLAEAGGGRRVGEEVEGVEERHVGRLAVDDPARHQGHAHDAHRVDEQQHEQRPAHVAQHDHRHAVEIGGRRHGIYPPCACPGWRRRVSAARAAYRRPGSPSR